MYYVHIFDQLGLSYQIDLCVGRKKLGTRGSKLETTTQTKTFYKKNKIVMQ